MTLFYIYLSILLLLACGGGFVLLLLARSSRRLRRENRHLLDRWELQNQYVDDLSAVHEKTAEIIEDIRELSDCLHEAGTAGKVLEEKCLQNCDALLRKIQSDSTVVDALLHSKQARCEAGGIAFHAKIQAVPKIGISEMELVSLLGNLLDNAIEAALASNADSPFVSIASKVQKSAWLLRVSNSKAPDDAPLANSMKTTKLDAAHHGMGVQIVRQIVESHEGLLKMEDQGDVFQATVSMLVGGKRRRRRG